MAEVKTPKTRTVALTAIKPYANNPRRVPPEAITAVRTSIEKYGYQQPIVVDKANVIVVGHTRYQALLEMGVKKVEVYVTDLPEDKVREYRLIDNRIAEYGQWDHDNLIIELREFEKDLLEQFFPDIDLEVGTLEDTIITEADVAKATASLKVQEYDKILTTKIECPACFHTFEVKTESLPGLSRGDLKALKNSS